MTSAPAHAVVPAWVLPDHRQVVELHHLTYRLVEAIGEVEAGSWLAAVEWIVRGGQAPVTHRPNPGTREQARAESWVALCVAAEAAPPTGRDWERLGVSPRQP